MMKLFQRPPSRIKFLARSGDGFSQKRRTSRIGAVFVRCKGARGSIQ